jgi:hypothetical protein
MKLRAFDAESGKLVWEQTLAGPDYQQHDHLCGERQAYIAVSREAVRCRVR